MMDRVQTLADKLVQQVNDKAAANTLLTTVQMLEAELLHLQTLQEESTQSNNSITVYIPRVYNAPVAFEDQITHSEEAVEEGIAAEEDAAAETDARSVVTLEVDEEEIEAELAEIRRNAAERSRYMTHPKPDLSFDPVEETPTLFHQQPAAETAPPVPFEMPEEFKQYMPKDKSPESASTELKPAEVSGEQDSLNDKLKQSRAEIGESFKETPIKDLKKGIGINDRFLFINELFRGDENMYERSIKTINGFAIFPEAEYWIKRELKLKLGWQENDQTVKQFDQLVRRRFL